MYQLYLFLSALLAMAAILAYRYWSSTRQAKEAFREKVASQIEENRKDQEAEIKLSFREAFFKESSAKPFDVKRYHQEFAEGELALARKEWERAKRHFIQAIAVAENELDASMKLAYAYLQTEEFSRAETLYRRLIELNPEGPESYQRLGWVLAKKKRYKEAIQAYVRAVELDQKNADALLALGKLYHLLMRYSVAGECFRRVAELKPRDVEALFLLAEACGKDEDFENSLFAYERILALEPYNEAAKSGLQEAKLRMAEAERQMKLSQASALSD